MRSQEQFTATQLDQFGNAMGTPPAVSWSAASGAITSTGFYTPYTLPSSAASGSDTVTASSGGFTATANVTIIAPAGWWKFNEGAGATADDASGNADNGTIADGAWLQPPNGVHGLPALQFDGSNSVVGIGNPAALDFSGQITFSAWIKPANLGADQYIINDQQSTGSDVFLMISGFGLYQIGFNDGDGFLHGAYAVIPPRI